MKNKVDKQYFQLLEHLLKNGVIKKDRTGTGTISVFDYSMRFDMSEGFPLLTSKKMFTKGVILELIWFLRGDTNIKFLVDNGCHIWDGDAYKNYVKHNQLNSNPEWLKLIPLQNGHIGADIYTQEEFINKIKTDDEFAKKWGELGPVYGKQWRNWTPESEYFDNGAYATYQNIDQIKNLISELKNNPDSRRLMVSAWNVGEIDKMVLPPCHYGFQCYTQELSVEERIKFWCDSLDKDTTFADDMTTAKLDALRVPKRKLSLKWTQRSVDTFLGLPFNIASYAFLLHLLAKEVNMYPHELIFSGGDVHLYSNHIEKAKEQLKRKTHTLPRLKLNNNSIFDLNLEDFSIIGYNSESTLKGELSN